MFGESGSGKSEFINQLGQKNLADTGHGRSVTTQVSQYLIKDALIRGTKFNVYDTPGVGDSDLDDSQIFYIVLKYFLWNFERIPDQIDGIFFAQKVIDNRVKINQIANDYIKVVFADIVNPEQHLVIVSTFGGYVKNDRAKQEQYDQMMQKAHLQHYQKVLWDSKVPLDEQFQDLQKAIENIKPFSTNSVKKLGKDMKEKMEVCKHNDDCEDKILEITIKKYLGKHGIKYKCSASNWICSMIDDL